MENSDSITRRSCYIIKPIEYKSRFLIFHSTHLIDKVFSELNKLNKDM